MRFVSFNYFDRITGIIIQERVLVHATSANHFFVSIRVGNFAVEMQGMVPIFTNNALNHLIGACWVFWVGVGTMAKTIRSGEVLIVRVRVWLFALRGIKLARYTTLLYSAVTMKVTLGVQFDQLMLLMTIVRASETNSDTFCEVVFCCFGRAGEACIKSLTLYKAITILLITPRQYCACLIT